MSKNNNENKKKYVKKIKNLIQTNNSSSENLEKKKYITLDYGQDFRAIAKIMTRKNFPMNHATARNVLMNSLSHFIDIMLDKLGLHMTQRQKNKILHNQKFHESLPEILFEVYKNIKEENQS